MREVYTAVPPGLKSDPGADRSARVFGMLPGAKR